VREKNVPQIDMHAKRVGAETNSEKTNINSGVAKSTWDRDPNQGILPFPMFTPGSGCGGSSSCRVSNDEDEDEKGEQGGKGVNKPKNVVQTVYREEAVAIESKSADEKTKPKKWDGDELFGNKTTNK